MVEINRSISGLAIGITSFGGRELVHTVGRVWQKFGCNLVPTLYFPSPVRG